MGFIPAIIALSAFILLWALFNSNKLKKHLEIIHSLEKSQKELEDYIASNKMALVEQKATLARNDIQQEQAKLAKTLKAQINAYNRSIAKNPLKMLAQALGYKPIA